MEAALQYYESSQDYHSIVRVHCYCGNQEKAVEICQDTGDKAACYHLARQYDSIGDIKKAIHFFSRAQAYSNAIRLAKVSFGYCDKLVETSICRAQAYSNAITGWLSRA